MTALTAGQGPDWFGMFLVVLICLFLCTAAYLVTWRNDRPTRIPGVPDDLRILDHATCVHPDCTVMLCFCPGLDDRGYPITCPGAQAPACFHSLRTRATTGGHCAEHQPSCVDCRVENGSLWGRIV